MKQLALLGATGSIGDSVCAIVRKHPERFGFFAMSAHSNWQKALQLAIEFKPRHLIITEHQAHQALQTESLPSGTQLHWGGDVLNGVVAEPEVDLVVAAIVGSAGMASVMAAVAAGKTLLLANKESIVSAGALVMPLAKEKGAQIIPLDSEHNAVFQCLPDGYQTGHRPKQVKHITLTASGGPFWSKPMTEFASITPGQAVAHPKWDMGAKISVDSATLMNKGLEVIEAHWLFDLGEQDIDVVVHPQSTIHSLVHYVDGSVLAQLGSPDMQIPISYGLGLRDRLENEGAFLDLLALSRLDFHEPDTEKFPCLRLAREAIQAGGTLPAVLNAANEVSVAAFLEGQMGFMEIPSVNESLMMQYGAVPVTSLEQLQALDAEVRAAAQKLIGKKN